MQIVQGPNRSTLISVLLLLSASIVAFVAVFFIYAFSPSLDITLPIIDVKLNKLPVSLVIFTMTIVPTAIFYSRHKSELIQKVRLYQSILFLFILLCGGSSVVVFSQNCLNYGLYDTADVYKVKPQTVLMNRSLTKRVWPKKSRRDCLYLSAITWTTIGYGDVIPSEGLRPMAAFEGVVAYLFMALLVSSLIEIIR